METINVSLRVKSSSEMTDEEFSDVLHNKLDEGKAGLMQWLWMMLEGDPKRTEIYNEANLYIMDDEDAKVFGEKFFSGELEPDVLAQDISNYIKWCYEQNYN